jgi:uroporphyrin-III C-methyltransferase
MQSPTPRIGKGYLVGAGPGAAELITVRGLRLIQQADVIIYDRLAAPELLAEARPDAELIYVGKAAGHHTLSQAEINALLVARVAAGDQVVRLKGGDPFVFGRGGEEALALRAAGLSFEIVPGISSAIAAPAYAGIPVTQRGVATSFTVVTGHDCAESSGTDWGVLAQLPTLIVLMGVGQIAEIATRLMAAGRAATTPAAAIQWGTTGDQQIVRASLDSIASELRVAKISSPAVIVIGEVAALHDELAWFGVDDSSATTDAAQAVPWSLPAYALQAAGVTAPPQPMVDPIHAYG